jgi:hypothetical protein
MDLDVVNELRMGGDDGNGNGNGWGEGIQTDERMDYCSIRVMNGQILSDQS